MARFHHIEKTRLLTVKGLSLSPKELRAQWRCAVVRSAPLVRLFSI